MRVSRLAFLLPLLALCEPASAQDRGVAVNMGRGLDNGMSVGWTFRENWTLRPTLGAGYSSITGFEAFAGSTLLRSFSVGDRLYLYAGAGVYYGSANSGAGGLANARTNTLTNVSTQDRGSLLYATAPIGVRARIYGNVEAFGEAAYQRTLSGQFGLSQTGQFSGNASERFGATVGLSLRLQ